MVEDIFIIDPTGVIKEEGLTIDQEDMTNIIGSILMILVLLLIVFIAAGFNNATHSNKPVIPIVSNTSIVKHNSFYIGNLAEQELISSLKNYGINSKAIFHNLYVSKSNGKYSQIDVAVLTNRGLIVFEVKNYSGWIYGNAYQKYWTQVLAYGKYKYKLYNPLMQNAEHIRALRQNLPQTPDIPIYSVVVFYGSAELKNISYSHPNVYLIYSNSICNVLQSIKKKPLIKDFNREEVWNVLKKASENSKNPSIVASHTYSVRNFINKKK